MHTNYFKCKTVKTFKTIIFSPTWFGLHKPSSGSFGLHFTKVTILIAIYKSLLKYSELWPHISFSPVGRVHYALCRMKLSEVLMCFAVKVMLIRYISLGWGVLVFFALSYIVFVCFVNVSSFFVKFMVQGVHHFIYFQID